MKDKLYIIIYTCTFILCITLIIYGYYNKPLDVNYGKEDGQAYLKSGDTLYRGELVNGKFHGFGMLQVRGKEIYLGEWRNGMRHGKGIAFDSLDKKIEGEWISDTLVRGTREDSVGSYIGEFNKRMQASGYGIYKKKGGDYLEGYWENDQLNGQAFALSASKHIQVGEWKEGKHLGQRVKYSSNRIYGIDISKYQHIIGKRTYPIRWAQLRIVHLGDASKKTIQGKVDYPISFIYIKSTEGATLLNPFYHTDYRAAKAHGYRVGSYHFFSIHSSAEQQARHFLKNSRIAKGDFPPVLDIEPTHEQIQKMGGARILFERIRIWLKMVERQTGIRPILYISQIFVNRYLPLAPDLKKNYDIWIARYGEYKPDVRLVYWQLSQDGRVRGIRGDVDINVFNGHQNSFRDFIHKYEIKD